jgi:cobalt-zinc-cadmium efflux system protein
VAALAVALVAARLARRPPSPDRSYGLIRAEVLAAFANGLFLALVCVLIFKEAIVRLAGSAPAVAGGPVLAVGLLGLAINLGSAWYLARGDRDNLNVRAALAHMLADALGSVGAALAAVFLLLGYPAADAVASLAIGGIILFGTWRLLRDASQILLQFAPSGVSCRDVERAVGAVAGVGGVHDLHAWSLDQATAIASLHVVIAPGHSPAVVRREVEAVLRGFGLAHATIQCEVEGDGACVDPGCSLGPAGSR